MPSPGRLLALGVLLGVLPSLHGSATPPQQQPPPQLAAGQVIESVRSLENPSQSYALYLPSTYAPDRAWPLLMAFDPSAEGAIPVKLFREAAEKYGYIVVGSNNSRNGPTRPSAEAFDALWRDVHTRFRVDDRPDLCRRLLRRCPVFQLGGRQLPGMSGGRDSERRRVPAGSSSFPRP